MTDRHRGTHPPEKERAPADKSEGRKRKPVHSLPYLSPGRNPVTHRIRRLRGGWLIETRLPWRRTHTTAPTRQAALDAIERGVL